ncbi:class E sortase [Angustibacter aerolatus]
MVRGAVHGIGELCITLGVVLLLFVVWQLWWTDIAAGRSSNRSVQSLEQQWQAPPKPGVTTAPVKVRELPLGDAFALIRVPRFGKDYVRPIIQGVELSVLDRGVGHYPDSADPGQVGNFAVAGHRVTYAKPFNQIAELRDGDAVVVETARTWYVYKVYGHRVVTPDRVDVVAPVPEHPGRKPTERIMTMTACHPKYSAQERYVVWSRLDHTIDRSTGGVPDELR